MGKTKNIFMRMIYDKNKTFILFRWFKYRKFLRQLDKSAPSFDLLWQIADFIKLLETVYFYDNSSTNELYSSNNFDSSENGFVIRKEGRTIRVKLYEYTREIALEVSYSTKNTIAMKFRDGENIDFKNEEHMYLILNVENIIMDTVKELFIKYYKMK